ncbi:MAG: helix-turn-helix transcriptional regulator [Brevundimonas sp.]
MSDRLSLIEIECVRLAGLGLEDKEIAAHLGISPQTVGNHLHRPYGTLGVSDPIEDGPIAPASAGRRRSGGSDRLVSAGSTSWPRGKISGHRSRRRRRPAFGARFPCFFPDRARRPGLVHRQHARGGLAGNHGPRSLRRLESERRSLRQRKTSSRQIEPILNDKGIHCDC